MRYYVYALIDPRNANKPFYIGKGIEDRVKSHFKEAMASGRLIEETDDVDCDIATVAENELIEFNKVKADNPKIAKLKELFQAGYDFNDIARIVAKNLDEPIAFALEAFLIKSVYGLENLTNMVEGEHAERFRPYNNWGSIEGFDFSTARSHKARQNRVEKLQLMLAEGLDQPLVEIQKAFPNLVFKEPKIRESGELAITTEVGGEDGHSGALIKIFTRKKNRIQIELRGEAGSKAHSKWIKKHFSNLEAYPLRGDDVFLPEVWKGSKNMTSDIKEAIERVELLLEIVNAQNRKQLSPEAILLLKGLPKIK